MSAAPASGTPENPSRERIEFDVPHVDVTVSIQAVDVSCGESVQRVYMLEDGRFRLGKGPEANKEFDTYHEALAAAGEAVKREHLYDAVQAIARNKLAEIRARAER